MSDAGLQPSGPDGNLGDLDAALHPGRDGRGLRGLGRLAGEHGKREQRGEVRITTADPEALQAVHAFVAARRDGRRAGGHGT